MRNFIICLLAFWICGCVHEDDLTASYADKNWFAVEDSEDPVQHELFLLYEKWGIPVFVNDTLGYEERGIDANGDAIVYYHVLNLDYTIDKLPLSDGSVTVKYSRYSLIEEDEDKIGGARFLDDYLLPALPKTLYYHSILLTDSLIENRKPGRDCVVNVREGMNVLAVGWIPDIVEMDQEGQERRVNEILQDLALAYIQKHQELLEEFYAESSDKNTLVSWYDKYVSPTGNGMYSLKSDRYEAYGFLSIGSALNFDESKPVSQWVYHTPKQTQDVEDFVKAVFLYSEEEFNEKYREYALVRNKFSIMRGIILDMGYELR